MSNVEAEIISQFVLKSSELITWRLRHIKRATGIYMDKCMDLFLLLLLFLRIFYS